MARKNTLKKWGVGLKNKDKKAKKRVDDEIKLKTKISKLLRDFSEEYDGYSNHNILLLHPL